MTITNAITMISSGLVIQFRKNSCSEFGILHSDASMTPYLFAEKTKQGDAAAPNLVNNITRHTPRICQ